MRTRRGGRGRTGYPEAAEGAPLRSSAFALKSRAHPVDPQSRPGTASPGRPTMLPEPQPSPRPAPHPGPSARDVLAPLHRARELQLAGQYAAAEARYRAVLKLDPYQPQALYHLALLVRSLGRPVEALKLLRTALELAPDLPGAADELARLLRALGR